MKKIIFILSVALLVLSCEKKLSGPSSVNGVQIVVGDESLTIINGTDEELRFFVVNQETLALILWAPYCLDSGLIIEPDGKETINYEDIYGYRIGCKVVVHWWACHLVDGALTPGDIQSTIVSTPSK